MQNQERFVPVDGYKVWYRSIGGSGDQEQTPLSHVEEPELYMQTVQAFLDRVESH